MKCILKIICLTILVIAVPVSNHALDEHRTPERALQETFYLPDGEVLRSVSLGYTSLLADILWIKSILYYGKNTLDDDNPFHHIIARNHQDASSAGDDYSVSNAVAAPAAHASEYDFSRDSRLSLHHQRHDDSDVARFLFPLLRRVAELEPHFLAIYEFGGLVVLKQTGAVREAIDLLQYGRRMNPASWQVPFHLGYIELFYNGNNAEAMKYLSQAMILPDTPPFVSHLYYSFMQKRSDTEIYYDYLKGLYETAGNEEVRKSILGVLAALDKRGAVQH